MLRDLRKEPFTDEEAERIKRLLTKFEPMVVAQQFNVTLKQITLFKKMREWSRERTHHDVGKGKLMSVSEIAEASGLSRIGVYQRIVRGVTGENLLAGKHLMPRKKKGELTERIEKVRKVADRPTHERIMTPSEKDVVRWSDQDDFDW